MSHTIFFTAGFAAGAVIGLATPAVYRKVLDFPFMQRIRAAIEAFKKED